jgi:hypothetical protein
MDIQVFWHKFFLNDYPFSTELSWYRSEKSVDFIFVGLFLDQHFLPLSCVYPYANITLF